MVVWRKNATGLVAKRLPLLAFVALISTAFLLPGQNARESATPSPKDIEIFQQGTSALQANQPEQAANLFSQVTHDAPRFAEAYLNLGLALARLSRNEEAVQALKKGIAVKPSMRGAHLFLAISEYKLGHFEPAALAIRKETSLNPGDAQAWMWRGIIDLALKRLTAAVEDLDHASAIDPRNVDILYHRGHAALELSRASYEEMFKQDPHSWHVSQVLAEADVESANDTDAIKQYTLAIASAPPQSGLYEALGSSYWRAGKYDEAQQAYETALKIDPSDILTMYKLGCLRVDRSDAAGGKLLLSRVLIADPSLVMTTYYLGRAEFQLGNTEAAIAYFNRTIHDNLEDETTKQAYFQLTRAYRRVHDLPASDKAQAQYRLLDQKTREVMQEKLSRQHLRADRDTSIPAPANPADTEDPSPTPP